MSDLILTANERFVVEQLRLLKAAKGHGVLRVDVRDGLEALVRPEPSLQLPERPAKARC